VTGTLYTADGNAKWCSRCGNTVWWFLKRLNIELPWYLAIPLLVFIYTFKGIESRVLKDYLFTQVRSSFIHNSQKVEANRVSFHK
jgi:hypothetical protein